MSKSRLCSAACLLVVLGLLVTLTGCPETTKTADPRGKVFFSYFDTVTYIYSYAGDTQAQFDQRTAAAAEVLQSYHNLFDIYYAHAGITNLYTINQNAGGEPLKVDRELIDFLLYAKELYTLTQGEMNVMMGAVLRPWHDCREAAMNAQGASIPSSETLAEAALHTDISLLEIDEANCTVRISDPDASIDVGALGKGYATEKAAEALRAMGAESYVLNVGGNIRIIGTKPDGGKWLTGIKDPADPDASYALYLNLANTSCVTSGSYERFFTVGGTRYHHIIDKDTGMPATYFPSVTIIAESSALADALSTALFCMPLEDGLALIASIPNAEALWILSDGSQHMSDGLQQYVTEPK